MGFDLDKFKLECKIAKLQREILWYNIDENEIWKDIVIENVPSIYEVSNYGRVRSKNRYRYSKNGKKTLIKGSILSSYLDKNGNPHVKLKIIDNYMKDVTIVSLVAKIFLNKNSDRKMIVNHIDGNKCNNRVDNLEIIRKKMAHKSKIGFKNPSPVYCIETDFRYNSINEMCNILRLNYTNVYNKLKNVSKGTIVHYNNFSFVLVK